MKKYWTLLMLVIVASIIFGIRGSASADEGDICTPQDAWVENIEHEAVTHEETVFDHWQRYSWTGGPHTSSEPPAFPSEDWQPNVAGDPHGVGTAGAYFVSHGNSGLGDWFYLGAVEKTVIIVDSEAWIESVEHPAVVCEDETETPEPPQLDECLGEDGEDLCVHETPEPPTEPTRRDPHQSHKPDPVVTTETRNEPTKTIKIYTHKSGQITREVTHYDMALIKEEGL